MNKLLPGALALVLCVSIAGCSKSLDQGATATSPTGSSSSATTPTVSMSTGTADDAGTATASATRPPIDQSTPESAMTSWLGSMVAGDGTAVCSLMAAGGKAIPSIPGAAAACGKSITPMLDQIKELGGAFQGLQINGATVKGDNATFESVTTEPALAADVVASFKAVRIAGKWYITQG